MCKLKNLDKKIKRRQEQQAPLDWEPCFVLEQVCGVDQMHFLPEKEALLSPPPRPLQRLRILMVLHFLTIGDGRLLLSLVHTHITPKLLCHVSFLKCVLKKSFYGDRKNARLSLPMFGLRV